MGLLFFWLCISIVFSFLCSIWEAVLLSITPSYISRKQKEVPALGNLLKKLKDDIDRPLSAILSLNTIAHTVGAIGVGAQAGKVWGNNYFSIFGWELSYETLVAAGMTMLILFLSEIIPKTLGANYWKELSGFTATSLKFLMWLLIPLIWLSTLLTKLLKKDKSKSVLSKQDFAAMADVIGETGEIKKDDHTIIKNVLMYDELLAKDVMTPRTVMKMANQDTSLAEYYKDNKNLVFSRIPLYKETPDEITGILLKDDLLMELVEGNGEKKLHQIKREVPIVGADTNLRKVFTILNESRSHIAVVLDEFGGLIGLLTLEDIIETIFGLEIMDEIDEVGDLQAYARQKWEKRAKQIGLLD